MTKNILLLGFICLAFATFSQNSIPIINKEDYNYYEDSLQGYPHPFRFYTAETRPEATNLHDVLKWVCFSEQALDIAYESGQIIFKVLVDEEGFYIKHFVVQGHPLPVKEISPHIPSLKFSPVIQNGKPIKFWVTIPLRYCRK